MGGNYNVTNSASHIKEYIEGTIERFGFAPDLYYLHRIDPSMSCSNCITEMPRLTAYTDTPLEESIPALDELRKAGKTKYIGLSECSAKTLRKANSSRSHFLFDQELDAESNDSCSHRRYSGRVFRI